MTDIENTALTDLLLNEFGGRNPKLKEQLEKAGAKVEVK